MTYSTVVDILEESGFKKVTNRKYSFDKVNVFIYSECVTINYKERAKVISRNSIVDALYSAIEEFEDIRDKDYYVDTYLYDKFTKLHVSTKNYKWN